MQTEFDDTVKQIQLFHRSGVYPFQLMILGYAPNLRHFLHRQSVYRASYWSCFDAIQEVRRKKAAVLSFHQLNWPDGIEFVYTPFVVIGMLNREKYAQIDFGVDGNPIQIDLYRGGRRYRRNIYDDRGFVSGSVIYAGEQPAYQDYLTEDGVWKCRYFYGDGHVDINENCPEYRLVCHGEEQRRIFSRLRYDSLEQMLFEVLAAYLELTGKQDIFCVAAHQRHMGLLEKALRDRKLILSFFGDRYQLSNRQEDLSLIRRADYVIADSGKNAENVRKYMGDSTKHIMAIPPYDSRIDMSVSQQLSVQNILVPVDGLGDVRFSEIIRFLGEYLPNNEEARICLLTRNAAYDRKQKMLNRVRDELKKAGLEEGWAALSEDNTMSENDLETVEKVPVRFFAEQCVDELAVSKCMREQRLLVELRDEPELFLQITAISMGIPQIVRTQTEFVDHGRNGIVLNRISELPKALDDYLNGLKNWNQARICSFELVREYTTDKLLEMWREVMNSVG